MNRVCVVRLEEVHSFHESSDDWTTRAQRALPLRLGPQI